MSTLDVTQATAAPGSQRKRSKLRWLKVALPPVILAGVGGAVAWDKRLLRFGEARTAPALDHPRLNIMPDSDPAHPRYKTSYLRIEGPFTTNLRNSQQFVQVELGISTDYDPVVLARIQTHEIPIRAAVLAILAQQSEATVRSPSGRALLEAELARAVDRVLVEREGFGGVGHVYLTGLVIQ